MSFALEYRKKMQAEAGAKRKSAGKGKSAAPPAAAFILEPPKKSCGTRANGRRVLAALAVAGLILSVFNSGALVHYAGGLGYNQAALRVMLATEDWHALMERGRATAVAGNIREAVTAARHSQWRDLAFGLDLTPTHPYLRPPETAGAQEPPVAVEEGESGAPEVMPEPRRLELPVKRAEAGR